MSDLGILIVLFAVAVIASLATLAFGNWFVARPVRAQAADMAATLESREREIGYSTAERQRLLAELLAAEEEERKRIAADIHDDSIQALGALLLRLELIESRLDDEELRASLGAARESAREAVARLRHLMFKISPPALDSAGLVSALQTYLDEIARVWGPKGEVESALAGEPSPEVRALVYRVAVEAVNNAAKHGRPGRIAVNLEGRDGGVLVCVEDDGAGFDIAEASQSRPGHLGLTSMRERAEAAGGWWRASSRPGRGSAIEFWIPDRPRADGDVPPDDSRVGAA
jgi:signal transduction histidine kinase